MEEEFDIMPNVIKHNKVTYNSTQFLNNDRVANIYRVNSYIGLLDMINKYNIDQNMLEAKTKSFPIYIYEDLTTTRILDPNNEKDKELFDSFIEKEVISYFEWGNNDTIFKRLKTLLKWMVVRL